MKQILKAAALAAALSTGALAVPQPTVTEETEAYKMLEGMRASMPAAAKVITDLLAAKHCTTDITPYLTVDGVQQVGKSPQFAMLINLIRDDTLGTKEQHIEYDRVILSYRAMNCGDASDEFAKAFAPADEVGGEPASKER